MNEKTRDNWTILSFDSFEEADEYNYNYYASLSPDERVEIGLELMKGYYETFPRLERLYRTTELGGCPVSSDRWMGV